MQYLLYFSILVLLLYRVLSKRFFYPTILSVLIGLLLFKYQGANIALLLFGVLIFDFIALSYGNRLNILWIAAGICYVFIIAASISPRFIAQAMFLGLIAETYRLTSVSSKKDKEKEINRDLIQILLGISIIVIFYLVNQNYASLILIYLVMLGYLVAGNINYLRPIFGKLLYSLEREYTVFGTGAVWLAIGTLSTIGFVSNLNYVIIILISIFIGDAAATIIGLKIKGPKLAYNKEKSFVGSITYFAAVSLIGYFFLGLNAIPFAFLASFVESLPFQVDDNFDVALILIILVNVLGH